jgi:hypothetical protein
MEEILPMSNSYCASLDYHKRIGNIVCVEYNNCVFTGKICNVTTSTVNIKIIQTKSDLDNLEGEIMLTHSEYNKFVDPYWMIYNKINKFSNNKNKKSFNKMLDGLDAETLAGAVLLSMGLGRLFSGN